MKERAGHGVKELCRRYGFSPGYLYAAWRRGEGPRYMLVGDRRIVTDEAEADWRRDREAAAQTAGTAMWRLDWRDYKGHYVGTTRPPCHHKRFESQAAALQELERLSAIDGADIRGFVRAIPHKPPPADQIDFGFPPDGKCRMTD